MKCKNEAPVTPVPEAEAQDLSTILSVLLKVSENTTCSKLSNYIFKRQLEGTWKSDLIHPWRIKRYMDLRTSSDANTTAAPGKLFFCFCMLGDKKGRIKSEDISGHHTQHKIL